MGFLMHFQSIKTKLFLAITLFFGASFSTFAFPIITTTATMYLTPLLIAFISGTISLYSKRSRKLVLSLFFLTIASLLLISSINTKLNNAPQKQKYDNNFERHDMNMSSFIPRSILAKAASTSDDFIHIKVQDIRKVLFNTDDTFGFSEHEKAIDLINRSGKSIVFLSSYRDGATLTFAEKISSKIKAKLYLVKSGSPFDFCEIEKCNKELNIIPFNSSDIHLYKRLSERGSKILEDFNIITSRSENTYSEMYRRGMIYIDSDLVLTRNDEYWEDLRKKLNPNKKVLLGMTLSLDNEHNLTNKYRSKIEMSYIYYIAHKLNIDTLYYTPSVDSLRTISFRPGDTIITPYFKGETTFITPLKALVKRKQSDNYYRTICFSDECVDTFGRNVSYNIANTKAITFDGEVKIDIEQIKNLYGISNGRILVSPHDTHSSMLARLVAHELVASGMDFAGFTEHYTRYYGNSRTFYIYGDYQFVYDDFWLDPILDVISYLDTNYLDFEFELNIVFISIICILFGVLSGIKGYSTRAPIVFVVMCILLTKFTYPPSSFMEKEIFIAPFTAILLGLYLWLKLKSAKIAVLGSLIVIIPFYFSSTDTLSNHVIALYSLGGILSCIIPRTSKISTINGDKYTMTAQYVPRKLKGKTVSRLDEAKNFIKNGSYLLRSNHLSFKEHGLSGYFDSYLVTSENIDSIWNNAVHDLKNKGLSTSDIQFWIMPFYQFCRKGVISSLGHNPAFIGVSISEGDDVTKGLSSGYRELARSRSEQKRFKNHLKINRVERKLVNLIKRIEEKEGMPVVMEFGINRFQQITVLQVRHQETDLLAPVVESILLGRYHVVSIDNFTRLGSDVISVLTDGLVICSPNGMAVTSKIIPSNAEPLLSPHNLLSVVDKLISLNMDNRLSLQSRIGQVRKIIKPIITAYFSGSNDIKNHSSESHQVIIDMCINYMQSDHIQDYDIGKEAILAPTPIKVSADSLTIKDLLRIILDISLQKIQASIKDSVSCNLCDFAGSSIEQFDNKIMIPHHHATNKSSMIIVVDGDFNGKRTSLSDFLQLDDSAKESVILYEDYIPVSLMIEAFKAKAIILRKGSLLSHICLTAKSLNKPLKIMP